MPNLIYQAQETAITFRNTGGSAVFDPNGLTASGNGHQSALYDLGTGDRSRWYAWRAFTKWQTQPVVGHVIRIYLKTSDGTNPDNDDGTGDAAVSHEDKLRNLKYIGRIECDEATATPSSVTFVASSVSAIELPHRYVGVVWWNDSDDQLSTTAADHGFDLIPLPDEVQ